MVMTALREGASGGILKFFLLGLLLLAGGGLVFMDIGGFFRGGIRNSDIAKAGDRTISITTFDRFARLSLSRLGMSPTQAYQLGYLREMLNGEIRTSLMQQEAANTGIRVGTQQVAANIHKILQPMTKPGQAPGEVLQQLLRAQGISEQDLINSISREMTVNLLGSAIQSGFLDTSETLATDIARQAAEKRNVEYIVFKDSEYKDTPDPTDEQLMEFYDATKEAFASPETRKAEIIIVPTDKLKDTIEISDEEIKETYERNIATYSEPEKRTIEQVILSDPGQADAIAKAVHEGKALKDAVKDVTGNTTDYIPPKATEQPELLEALKEPVFSAKEKDILGPIESPLGAHVVVVTKITPEHTTPLSEVKKDIRDELMETRVLDAQYDLANTVDDYLAAGEDTETLKKELGVTIEEMPAVNSFGLDAKGKAIYPPKFGPDASTLTQSLFELGEGQASPVMELADGRMAALMVTEITDKTYQPFEDVKPALKKQWLTDTRRGDNRAYVQKTLNDAERDGIDFKEIAATQKKLVQNASGLTRTSEEQKPLTASTIQSLFEAPMHKPIAIDIEGGAAIAVVQKSTIPEEPDEKAVTASRTKLMSEQQNEAYTLYVQNLQDKYGVRVNEKLLQSVYGGQDTQ